MIVHTALRPQPEIHDSNAVLHYARRVAAQSISSRRIVLVEREREVFSASSLKHSQDDEVRRLIVSPTSLKSGFGLFRVGKVCSLEPPADRSSRSFELRHFILLFWNQIFTCESRRPSFSASFLLSGLLMYFCIWNLFSKPTRWPSENTARLIMPRRGFPLDVTVQGKLPELVRNGAKECCPPRWACGTCRIC